MMKTILYKIKKRRRKVVYAFKDPRFNSVLVSIMFATDQFIYHRLEENNYNVIKTLKSFETIIDGEEFYTGDNVLSKKVFKVGDLININGENLRIENIAFKTSTMAELTVENKDIERLASKDNYYINLLQSKIYECDSKIKMNEFLRKEEGFKLEKENKKKGLMERIKEFFSKWCK